MAAANAEAMRLEGLNGDETDPAADSLRGQLAAANAEAMRLEGLPPRPIRPDGVCRQMPM